jgi:hypothetical protein
MSLQYHGGGEAYSKRQYCGAVKASASRTIPQPSTERLLLTQILPGRLLVLVRHGCSTR